MGSGPFWTFVECRAGLVGRLEGKPALGDIEREAVLIEEALLAKQAEGRVPSGAKPGRGDEGSDCGLDHNGSRARENDARTQPDLLALRGIEIDILSLIHI